MIFQGFPVVISLVMVFGSFLMVGKVSNFIPAGNEPKPRPRGYLANAAREAPLSADTGQVPAVMGRQQPDCHNSRGTNQHGGNIWDCLAQEDIEERAKQGGAGIYMLNKDKRRIASHNIPHHAAPDACHHTHKNKQE